MNDTQKELIKDIERNVKMTEETWKGDTTREESYKMGFIAGLNHVKKMIENED